MGKPAGVLGSRGAMGTKGGNRCGGGKVPGAGVGAGAKVGPAAFAFFAGAPRSPSSALVRFLLRPPFFPARLLLTPAPPWPPAF